MSQTASSSAPVERPSISSDPIQPHPAHVTDAYRTTSGIEPIEPTISTGLPMMVAEEGGQRGAAQSHLVFAFLRKEKPLPGKTLAGFMLFALFLVMFLAGWNDASQGPLLPSLQEYYHVTYLIIAFIWVSSMIGFVLAGIANVPITDRFGFGIAAPFGAAAQALGYVFMCWGGPYPLFVCAYLAVGFGVGLQDAQVNSLTSRLPGASTKMFLLHAVYGFGATVSPFVSTAFVQHDPDHVYFYFAVSLVLAVVTLGTLVLVFRGRTEDQVVGKRLPDDDVLSADGGVPMITTARSTAESSEAAFPSEKDAQQPADASRRPEENEGETQKIEGSGSKMRRIMQTPATHFMAFYLAIYVGIEVTIGGWATSFILDERGGDSNAGYVTTGYFGGLTLGRVLLIPVTNLLGQHNAVYAYSVIVLALEFVIWFTYSIPGNAVAFAFIGFFLGPMYPIVMMVVTEVMPGELQAGTFGWLASLGQAGSAAMPFITGAISDRYGIWILQPLVIAFLVADVVLWAFVPRHRKDKA